MNSTEFFLFVLAIFGGLDLASRGFAILVNAIPRLLSFKSRAWNFIADSYSIPTFRRRAIATRVEEVLNQTAFNLQQHLPKGWVKRARIRWVRAADSPKLQSGDVVLRVRPDADPDRNLMRSLWLYFCGVIFPDVRDIVPGDVVGAVALAITRAGLENNHPYLVKEFDEQFLPAVTSGRQSMVDCFADCVRLNDFGLLMGPFVREVDYAAANSRFGAQRPMLSDAVSGILAHMLAFQPLLRLKKPAEEWSYLGPCAAYGFLLVSKPPVIRPGVEAYVRRARAVVEKGVRRIYVIGRREERDFVLAVVTALLEIRELKGLELFPLFRDYRGEPNGVGALVGVDQLLLQLKPSQRALGPLESPLEDAEFEPPAAAEDGAPALSEHAQRDLSKIAEDLIIQLSDYEGAWISLAEFGAALRGQIPEFTPQRYGGRNLYAVLRKLDTLEFDERGSGPAKQPWVRLRNGADSQPRSISDAENVVRTKIAELVNRHGDEKGWIFLGNLGHFLRREMPEFEASTFGASSFHEFVARIPLLEVEERAEGHSKTYVRRK